MGVNFALEGIDSRGVNGALEGGESIAVTFFALEVSIGVKLNLVWKYSTGGGVALDGKGSSGANVALVVGFDETTALGTKAALTVGFEEDTGLGANVALTVGLGVGPVNAGCTV